MPRVNLEEKAWSDQRIRYLATCSGDGFLTTLGRLCGVWRECYSRSVYCLDPKQIDIAADRQGFCALLLAADLGVLNDDGTIRIRGTKGRVEWVLEQRNKAKKGGEARAKHMLSKGLSTGLANAKANAKASAKAKAKALAYPNAYPSFTLSTLTAKPETFADAQVEPSPSAQVHDIFPSSEPLGFSLSGSGSSEPIGEILSLSGSDPVVVGKREEKRQQKNEDLRAAIDVWDKLYREASGGLKPTWNASTIKPIKDLLASHPLEIVSERMIMLYKRPPQWLRSDSSLPSTKSFLGLFDRLVERVEALPVHSGKNYNPTKFFRDRAIEQEAKDNAAIAAGGEAERALSIFDVLSFSKKSE